VTLRQVLEDVATVRGLDPPLALDAALVARSDLPALLKSLITDEDRRWFANTTTLYRLLGHLRDDQDYLTVWESFGSESVLGLYSPLDKRLWVVHSDGKQPNLDDLPRQEKETLAHEFAHAVQDFHFDLQSAYRNVVNDLDANLAWTCVVEGDAVTTQQEYSRRFAVVPGAGRLYLIGAVPQASDVPQSIARELFLPYSSGAQWVRSIVSGGGPNAVDALLRKPPRATAYVLHPEYLDTGWEPVPVSLPDLSGTLGAGWTRQSGGTFGEFQVRNYLQLRLPASEASRAAAGWAGDRYDVYVNGGESVATFRVKFASADDAGEFSEAQQALLASQQAASVSRDAITVATFPGGKATAMARVSADEAIFAIGSSEDAATRALDALTTG
jgi:hypothetical protein